MVTYIMLFSLPTILNCDPNKNLSQGMALHPEAERRGGDWAMARSAANDFAAVAAAATTHSRRSLLEEMDISQI